MKTISTVLLTLAVAVPATWLASLALRQTGSPSLAPSAEATRKVRFYQSAMHPWIKSDKPGRCTLCGMELTPVYEGDSGLDSDGGGDVVPLTQSMIQVLKVQTTEARVRPLEKNLPVAGIIDDDATRHRVISAYTSGRVAKLYVNFMGAAVKEGQPLAEFYSPSLLQAEREYRTLTGSLRSAAALRLLQMGLTETQIAELTSKSPDKLTSQILAPAGGTVVAKNVYEGQYVQEGEKLFEVADFSTMWFQFRAYEQDLPWIKTGLAVEVTTPSHPGNPFTGRVTFIDPTLDEVTRSAIVRVELANPPAESGHAMMHKLYADGLIRLEAPEVLSVPRSAVIQTGPEAVVYVELGEGAYQRRVLRLGRRGDALVEVLSGLATGEKVVSNGNLLIDGQAEMNRAFATAEPRAPAEQLPSTTRPPFTEQQHKAVQNFLTSVDAITSSLAADNLGEFNALALKAQSAASAMMESFSPENPWREWVEPFKSADDLKPADSLKTARQLFHPLSKSAVALAKLLKRDVPEFASLRIFRCPMTKEVFPGAPNRAEWIQLQSPIRNPYFGAEMLDCGSEVKP